MQYNSRLSHRISMDFVIEMMRTGDPMVTPLQHSAFGIEFSQRPFLLLCLFSFPPRRRTLYRDMALPSC